MVIQFNFHYRIGRRSIQSTLDDKGFNASFPFLERGEMSLLAEIELNFICQIYFSDHSQNRRQSSTPLHSFLTYVSLPWFSIAKDLLDHREMPILTF